MAYRLLPQSVMLDRDTIFQAFRQALEELSQADRSRELRPRTIALRAHEIYCLGLEPGAKKPSHDTFRKFATGQWSFPRVLELLQNANIRAVPPQRLDRRKLRLVFEEAILRLENRLLKGQARPRQIVRRAYELYTRDAAQESLQPSHRTFERLVYGKAADPEILTLVEAALAKPQKTDETSGENQ